MMIFPAIGAVVQLFGSRGVSRWTALGASIISGFFGVMLVATMQSGVPEPQAQEVFPWIGSYAIHYEMAIDGLSAPLAILISILFPILIAAEWGRVQGQRGMNGLFLILQAAFVGTVCARDLFLQFFFWALMPLPTYFLVGIWGGEKKDSAATQSMVASVIGNVLMFGALILIYYSVDPHSFSLQELGEGKLNGKTFLFLGRTLSLPGVVFALVACGLAIRAAVWPLNGWFLRVAEEAPLSVVALTGALSLPTAIYLFERLAYTLFQEDLLKYSPTVVGVGTLSLVAGALCALSQRSLRTLLAFLCLSQIGIALIGDGALSAPALVGAIYQKLVLGLGIAGFALFAGVLGERQSDSEFLGEDGKSRYGGLALGSPAIAILAGTSIASLLGLPGLGGFVGFSLVFLGSFASYPVAVLFSGVAVAMSSYSVFMMYRHVFLGEPQSARLHARALSMREKAYLFPVILALLLFGLYPKPLIELIRPTASVLLSMVR